MIGFRTIRQGQRAAVWDMRGRVNYIAGPRRLFLFRQQLQPMELHSAAAHQYLIIRHKDGHAEHVPGPASVWFDPVQHESVTVMDAMAIDAHEALIVYRRETEHVVRRVVRGPALFVPTPDEWFHVFHWHGSDPRNPRKKIPRALSFTKLRVIPDQMYFDVEEVRTADDALLTIKLMVFFELADIERMLDSTHDPIADFINALSADVIDFAAQRTFAAFKEQTEALNELSSYANLNGRAERVGYRITKVVYRGYHASDKLQAMHDGAIETRTGLQLQAETETQAQALADMKLQREAQRVRQQQEMAAAQAEHDVRLQRTAHEEKLRQREADARRAREDQRLLGELKITQRQSANQQRLAMLTTMQSLQIDLTRYLVAQYQHPDRLIRIDGSTPVQVHTHSR